ncbi:DMT family transporter [Alicyclobacillus dauci]|uniref:DMT family transporter n=1 Tax=Alicyclobacillus dauci TaxID=1475485 RepID=A0ABY6Z1P2_9BACL|nr:DMT family transporter [Alicyclobacillus dauci]WAH35900.1 DMT family transporter [Alicyclobacillus dauci]
MEATALLKTPKWMLLVLLLIANLIWSGSFPATSIATNWMSPTLLSTVRLLIGGLVLFPFVVRARRRNREALSAVAVMKSAVLGVIGFTLPLTLETFGIHVSSPALGAVSIALEPLLTVFLTSVVYRQRLGVHKRLAMGIAAVGAYVIAGCPRPGFAGYMLGDILLLLAVLCYATYNSLSSRMTQNIPATAATSIMLLAGFVGCVPLWVLSGATIPHHVADGPLVALLYLSLLATAGAYLIWLFVLQDQDVSSAAISLYLQSIFGVLLSVLIVHTRPSWFFYTGAAMILAGLYLGKNEPRSIQEADRRNKDRLISPTRDSLVDDVPGEVTAE